MFRRDTQDKNPYHLREDMITYITSPNQADRTAASILHYLKEDNHEYNYVGFDVEGTSDPKTRRKTPPETLQLYTVAGDNKRATIYQMKKIAPRKSLPRDLEELLSGKTLGLRHQILRSAQSLLPEHLQSASVGSSSHLSHRAALSAQHPHYGFRRYGSGGFLSLGTGHGTCSKLSLQQSRHLPRSSCCGVHLTKASSVIGSHIGSLHQ